MTTQLLTGDVSSATNLTNQPEFTAHLASNVHKQVSGVTQSGSYSSAEGYNTTASGGQSHAEGSTTNSIGSSSHAEGSMATASGNFSHAEGASTLASGNTSHTEGNGTTASGDYSHAEGYHATTGVYASRVSGEWNKALIGNATTYSGTADALVIGNGTSSGALGNSFRVTFDGKTYGLSAFNSTGADYAEYFEWLDGNINSEERIGYFVTLDGEMIRKANSSDAYILGIVSATPSVIGDSYDDWQGKYLTDEWGRVQFHDVTIAATSDIPEHIENQPIYNPSWNPLQEYIAREYRKEWSAIGMVGKLLIRDDGTCAVNGYCKSNDDGIGTNSTSGYRVMKRVASDIIQVLFK